LFIDEFDGDLLIGIDVTSYFNFVKGTLSNGFAHDEITHSSTFIFI
jgi:hypothetical protein